MRIQTVHVRQFPEQAKVVAKLSLALAALYAVTFNLSRVRGNSMSSAIRDGDHIFVEPWSYLFGGPERGDIILFRCPVNPGVDFVKRVIGLPGDRVTVVNGRAWVNGQQLDEPYVLEADPDTYFSTLVADGCYFVLGDNRARSTDSRDFGQVPEGYIHGRVDLRLWPLERIGFVR